MSEVFTDHAVAGVRGLLPYEPGKPEAELKRELGLTRVVKLASNENPLGAGTRAKAALAGLEDFSRYPDGNGFELKQALAGRHGIEPGRIVLGNGSNDVLDLAARVFLTPGRNAVFSRHAFAIYPIATLAAGAQPRAAAPHPADGAMAHGHDLDAMAAAVDADTGVVFIANPNNPTGTWAPPDAIEALLEGVPAHVPVVLDEAYREYMDPAERPPSRQWLDRYPNLVVTRTFSKIHGLAGLRAGYALCHADMADLLNRVRQPFNISSAAQSAALAALDDEDHVSRSQQLNSEQRHWLAARLKELGLTTLPSQANFVTVDTGRDAAAVFDALLREGVIVRPLAGYELPQALRFTVGTAGENREAVEALARVLGRP
jgi:histidinol-phosphate aminotransferase